MSPLLKMLLLCSLQGGACLARSHTHKHSANVVSPTNAELMMNSTLQELKTPAHPDAHKPTIIGKVVSKAPAEADVVSKAPAKTEKVISKAPKKVVSKAPAKTEKADKA